MVELCASLRPFLGPNGLGRQESVSGQLRAGPRSFLGPNGMVVGWDGRNLSWWSCVLHCGPFLGLMAWGGRNLSRVSCVLAQGPFWDPMAWFAN